MVFEMCRASKGSGSVYLPSSRVPLTEHQSTSRLPRAFLQTSLQTVTEPETMR